MKKTNAARILDRHKIDYKIVSYEVDQSDLSALHVARYLGEDIKKIFKTLVLTDENNTPLVACIPGDAELYLKALTRVAGCKKCTMLPLKYLLKTTGYIRGGCSPVGMKKQYQTFIDESVLSRKKICISAGIRGEQIELGSDDFISLFLSRIENITK